MRARSPRRTSAQKETFINICSFNWGPRHIGHTVNRTISSLSTLTANVAAITASAGAWESTFDVWAGNDAHEI